MNGIQNSCLGNRKQQIDSERTTTTCWTTSTEWNESNLNFDSNSEVTDGFTKTTDTSSVKSSATNYDLPSLVTDDGTRVMGTNLTSKEIEWLELAREYTSMERPAKIKARRVVRCLRGFSLRKGNGLSWTLLRRKINGLEDLKNNQEYVKESKNSKC